MDYNEQANKSFSGGEGERKIRRDIVKMIQHLDGKTLKLVYNFVRGIKKQP